MTTRNLFLSVLVLSATIGAVAQTQTHDIKVDDFDNLEVLDKVNVVYVQSDKMAGHITFKATKAIAKEFLLNSNNGKLKIETRTDAEKADDYPTLTIYSSTLSHVYNDSECNVTIDSIHTDGDLKVRVMGNGSITLKRAVAQNLTLNIITGKGTITCNGKCENLTATVVGKGRVNAENLVATNATCRLTGVGEIKINVHGGEIKAKGSGGGKIIYKGTPSKVANYKNLIPAE